MLKFIKQYSLIFLMFLIPIAGCAGKIITNFNNTNQLSTEKCLYIIENEYSIKNKIYFYPIIGPGFGTAGVISGPKVKVKPFENTAEIIKKELNKFGINAIIGKESEIPEDIKIIVRYYDVWEWDIKMYLKELTIIFRSIEKGENLVAGSFVAAHLHNFPTSKREVPKIIEKIFNKSNNL